MRATLYWVEGFPVAIMPRPRGGEWLADELTSLRAQGVEVLASLITSEEALELEIQDEACLAVGAGMEFLHLPIQDRGVPDDPKHAVAVVDVLAARARNGKVVGIHCRAGIGRSGMIAALVLWRLGLTIEEAFSKLATARRCPVPDTVEQRAWATRIAANFEGP